MGLIRCTIGPQISHEARINHDNVTSIELVNDSVPSARLGWYSAKGGEIGDIPVKEAGISLPSSSAKSTWPTARARSRSSSCGPKKHDAPATRIA